MRISSILVTNEDYMVQLAICNFQFSYKLLTANCELKTVLLDNIPCNFSFDDVKCLNTFFVDYRIAFEIWI